MDSEQGTGATTFVITVDAIKWAIEQLAARRIHPHFLAYLQLRKQAVTRTSAEIRPEWKQLEPLLAMPGGPPKKPNYRPFRTSLNSDPANFWFNGNLAGSFATSSIRSTAGFLVDGNQYVLPSDHVDRALEALLYERPAPALAAGAFLLRNFGFRSPTALSVDHIIAGLRQRFALEDDAEFDRLFDTAIDPPKIEWFEPSAKAFEDDNEH